MTSATKPTTVQEAIRQSKPFDTRREEGLIAIMLTAEAVRWSVRDLLGDHQDLTSQQYNVLRILRGAGENGLPTLDIADRMIERAPGISRMLDRLEAKGLVRRERSATDRRQVFCRIMPRGLELLTQLDGPIAQLHDRVMSVLDDDALATLIDSLDAIRNNVR